jgi:hypothetical protein
VTSIEALARVIARLGLEGSDAHTDADLEPLVDEALKDYFTAVATGDDDAKRQLIYVDFTVALTTGTGSLTTPFAASQPLIAGADKHWRVLVDGETLRSSWLPDVQSLQMGRNRLVSYFAVSGSTLGTRDRTGSLTGFTGINATVSGPAILTIANVPAQLASEAMGVLEAKVAKRIQGGS